MHSHLEPDHEALELLLVQREVACFDGEHAVAAEAEHVLKVGVPGHRVGILLLRVLT